MVYQYPVCKLWLLLVQKYNTTQPFKKFSAEHSLDYQKVIAYGRNTFKKLDMDFVQKLCKALNCDITEMLIEDKVAYLERKDKEIAASKRKRNGVVYFVQNDEGLVKIGRTQYLKSRLQTLKYDPRGKGIKLLHVIESSDINTLEKTLHKVFSPKRVEGEWFSLTQEDIQLFK